MRQEFTKAFSLALSPFIFNVGFDHTDEESGVQSTVKISTPISMEPRVNFSTPTTEVSFHRACWCMSGEEGPKKSNPWNERTSGQRAEVWETDAALPPAPGCSTETTSRLYSWRDSTSVRECWHPSDLWLREAGNCCLLHRFSLDRSPMVWFILMSLHLA